MSIDAIYACKLFRSSTRKSAIIAAINDPVNVELVEQLSTNLSEESKEDLIQLQQDTEDKKSSKDDKTNSRAKDAEKSEKSASSDASAHKPSTFSPSHTSKSFDEKHDLSNELKEEQKDVDTESTSAAKDSDDAVSESRVHTRGESIVANRYIQDISEGASVLLGTLNADSSTAGVVRVQIKSDELWIVYSDNINLNTVMENVIYKLNSLNYTMLEFNRLARTMNAVVFTINEVASPIRSEDALAKEVKASD